MEPQFLARKPERVGAKCTPWYILPLAKCTPWYILPLAKCTRKIASGRDSRKRPHKFVFEFLGSPCAGEDQILTNIFCSCSPHFNHILLTFLLYFCLLFLFNSAFLFEINFSSVIEL